MSAMVAGILPVISLAERSKCLSAVSCDMLLGSEPLTPIPPTEKLVRILHRRCVRERRRE
jgi:hypothetical protein